jgi:hypothetical protein
LTVHRCPTAFLPKLSSKLKAESSKEKTQAFQSTIINEKAVHGQPNGLKPAPDLIRGHPAYFPPQGVAGPLGQRK